MTEPCLLCGLQTATHGFCINCKKKMGEDNLPLTMDEEVKCIRALLERILRVLDEGKFVDYQLEKFGRIVKRKE